MAALELKNLNEKLEKQSIVVNKQTEISQTLLAELSAGNYYALQKRAYLQALYYYFKKSILISYLLFWSLTDRF